jgi:LysR family glycine cleavage system transcriptional activator
MIRNELHSGLLMLLSPLALKSANGYWLEVPLASRSYPVCGIFMIGCGQNQPWQHC